MNRTLITIPIVLGIALLIGFAASDVEAQRPMYTPPTVQQDSTGFWIFNGATMGPRVSLGYSRMSNNIPDGWTTTPRLAYTFGLTSYFSLSNLFAVSLALQYDTRDHYIKHQDIENVLYEFSYIDIQPSIRFFWLLLGLSIDLPVSGQALEKIGTFVHLGLRNSYTVNRDIEPSDMASLMELHAAIEIPVSKSESGEFRLLADVRYPLGKTLLSSATHDSTGHFGGLGEGPLLTVQGGFVYLFDLLH